MRQKVVRLQEERGAGGHWNLVLAGGHAVQVRIPDRYLAVTKLGFRVIWPEGKPHTPRYWRCKVCAIRAWLAGGGHTL
jgi:hypothetical protein